MELPTLPIELVDKILLMRPVRYEIPRLKLLFKEYKKSTEYYRGQQVSILAFMEAFDWIVKYTM